MSAKASAGIGHIVVILVIFLLVIAGVVVFGISKTNEPGVATITTSGLAATKEPLEETPSSPPFAFQELTIPYLASREYKGSLGELERISQNSSYTSYLTSYESDGFQVNALLTVPATGPGPWPAVVFVHGYVPPANYRTAQRYTDHVDALAKEGLVVFKIDLRGHGESEGLASGAYYSGDYIIDTLNAVSALQSIDFVDAQKIGLWGHSMAGNVVFRAAAASPLIRNVAIWAGAVYTYEDFSDYRISDGSYRPPPQESERQRMRDELFGMYGRFDPESEFWKQVPATNYLGNISSKIQIHHAADDGVVSPSYSRNLFDMLKNSSIVSEYFEYNSGGHNITGASFTRAMQRTAEFLKN